MKLSLRDQLLQAGLVQQKQVKQATQQQKKQVRLEKKGQRVVDAAQQDAARQALAEKAARDTALNQAIAQKAEQKARKAEVIQLIESTRLPKLNTEDYYNFVDHKKVKRIAVNQTMRNKLSAGTLGIVRHAGGYEIVPRAAALKIQERDPSRVVSLTTESSAPDAEDPYAAYQVPDDLMW